MTVSDFWVELAKLVLSFIGGGFASTLLNRRYQLGKERRDLSLKLIDQYTSMYIELAEVLALLAEETPLHDPERRNKVYKVGNWFDFVALLRQEGFVDSSILRKVGLDSQLRDFRGKARSGGFGEQVRRWRYLEAF